jgi:putative transposase
VPTYRKKAIFGSLRKQIGKILRAICEQGGIEGVEGPEMVDHVHLCLSSLPKNRVAPAVGRRKGKLAIRIPRAYLGRAQNFTGYHFWANGYGVRTGGFDEQQVVVPKNAKQATRRDPKRLPRQTTEGRSKK